MKIDFEEHYGIWYESTLIDFNVICCNRKSLKIAVLPDSGVEVSAPTNSSEDAIREKVKKRAV